MPEDMRPRFVGRLAVADAVTVANAAVGFLAVATAMLAVAGRSVAVDLGARLVLLAGIADGLDGVLARRYGGSAAGPYLDSLADVASFAVAPAALVFAVAVAAEGWTVAAASPRAALTLGLPAGFVAMAVLRLGLYTAHDAGDDYTEGVQSTLAGTILAAAILAGVEDPRVLLAASAAFCYLMVSTVRYPDLLARDAFLMGAVHALALLFPRALDRSFPVALLTLGVAYLTLGPWLYWRGDWLLGRVYDSLVRGE